MITGYNTDVEYDGVVYHVQTEDKGLQTPIILSLVYVGGAILASKRVPYDDLITAGFDKQILTERLNRQHKLICAAVHAGRIEELKRMGERDAAAGSPAGVDVATSAPVPAHEESHTVPVPEPVATPFAAASSTEPLELDEETGPLSTAPMMEPAEEESDGAPETAVVPPPQEWNVAPEYAAATPVAAVPAAAPPDEPEPAPAPAPAPEPPDLDEPLSVRLIDEPELRSGASVVLKFVVTVLVNDSRLPAANARLIVKTLGSAFPPNKIQISTDKNGEAAVSLSLPIFNRGRAAILVQAHANGVTAELRRIIQPGSN